MFVTLYTRVLWWACLYVCLSASVSPELAYTASLHRIFAHELVTLPMARSSLHWRRCDTLYTYGFTDDVIFFSRNGQEIKAINAIIKAYAESISRERACRSTNLTAQHIYSNWPTRGQHRTGGERLTSTTALFCINVDVCKATATIHCSIQYNKLQQLAHRINRERDSALIDIRAGCRPSHCDWRI